MKPSDPTIPTGTQSNTSFVGAFGDIAEATTINKLRLKLREPAKSVHIVPKVRDSLLSTSKMVDANYIAVYNKEEVNFYDAKTTKIVVTEEAVLTSFRCPETGLWRVPLVENPTNLNTDTLILDHPTKLASLNSLYEVITTTATRERVNQLMGQATEVPCPREHINNVYELPSIEHRASSAIPTCCSRASNEAHMAESNSTRKLQLMAAHKHSKCEKAFPRVRGDTTWAHERCKAKRPQHATIGIRHSRRGQ